MVTGNEQYIIDQLDSMPINEARKAIASGQFGSPGRPGRAFASELLASKEAEERDKRKAESLSISRKALFMAKAANIWAAIATLIAAIAMYIAYVEYIKSP